MGHINVEAIKILLKENNVRYTSSELLGYNKYIYETCLQAKANRHINKKSNNIKPYQTLERIHSNLGGPIKPQTYNKHEYYITFLDKKTRFLEVTLLRNKDDAFEAFTAYKAKAENIANNKKRKITEFFINNGGEFIN